MPGAKEKKPSLIRVDMMEMKGPVTLSSEEVFARALTATREVPPGLLVVYP